MEITVKEFIELLQKEEPSRKLVFSGLDFYRLKDRDAFVQVEFNQIVGKDENGNVYVENP